MMQQLIGWWMFDAAKAAITHSVTGQSLYYGGVQASTPSLSLPVSGNRKWMRFHYEDAEVSFPLLVEWRNIPSTVAGRPLVWRLDYTRSAALWRTQDKEASFHPPYGLWRRLDEFLTDALPCWPEDKATGAKPSFIGFSSGWLNGSWNQDFYRSVWCSTWLATSANVFHAADLTSLDLEAPSPWRLFPAEAFAHAIERLVPAEVLKKVPLHVQSQGFLGSEDLSRLLLASPIFKPQARSCRINQIFYAGQDFVTDTLQIGVDCFRDHVPRWTVYFRQSTLVGTLRRDTGLPVPWLPSGTKLPNGSISQARYIPHSVGRQLVYHLLDALMSDFDARWVPEDGAVRADAVRSVFVVDHDLAGSAVPSRIEAVTSLVNPLQEYQNPISFMFDEVVDGISRSIVPIEAFGFWKYDPASKSLVNSASGQVLRFLGRLTDNEPAWQFCYEDQDVSYPCVVLPVRFSRSGTIFCRWTLDHSRSAALWRVKDGGDATPSYGLWRRVSNCVVDALLCWPEIEDTGPVPYEVIASGGWFNAKSA